MREAIEIKGKIIELTNIFVIFELGIKIIKSQNGRTPKLQYKKMLFSVKYS